MSETLASIKTTLLGDVDEQWAKVTHVAIENKLRFALESVTIEWPRFLHVVAIALCSPVEVQHKCQHQSQKTRYLLK